MSSLLSAIVSLVTALFVLTLRLATFLTNAVSKRIPTAPAPIEPKPKAFVKAPPEPKLIGGTKAPLPKAHTTEVAATVTGPRRFVAQPTDKFEKALPFLLAKTSGTEPIGFKTEIAALQKMAVPAVTSLQWRRFVTAPLPFGMHNPLTFFTTAGATWYAFPQSMFGEDNRVVVYEWGLPTSAYQRAGDPGVTQYEKIDALHYWALENIKQASDGHPPAPLALRPRPLDEILPEEPPAELGDWPDADGLVWVVTSHSRRRLPPSRLLLSPPLRALPKPSVVTA